MSQIQWIHRTITAVLELPLRRTTICWDHFKATKKNKMLLLFMEAEESSSCGELQQKHKSISNGA
jgi:hypothetical protein